MILTLTHHRVRSRFPPLLDFSPVRSRRSDCEADQERAQYNEKEYDVVEDSNEGQLYGMGPRTACMSLKIRQKADNADERREAEYVKRSAYHFETIINSVVADK